MQMQISLKTTSALDNRNAQLVLAAHELIQQGKATEAWDELRKIERRVASHPAVIQLRRNLVASLYGWEQEDTAISRLQPAPAVNGHNDGDAAVNGNGNGLIQQEHAVAA
ncbi:MAG TPA: hypothetical protein VJ063_04870 [Verrucomicrobiae bacterium]|nr:hypothetical protein [Verrucomicrobiae bacterium]